MKYSLARIFLVIAIFLHGRAALSQNTIGIPTIVNYSKQAYTAGSQNWNIAQDNAGIMYFANNDGLLSFDGTSWRLYPLPNKTITRSLAIDKQNRIYVGGQGEIGYFLAGANGELAYTSLNILLPPAQNDFADVWNTCIYQDRVFFRANKKILEYDGNRIIVHPSVNWGFLGAVNGKLIANENNKGLVTYNNGQWTSKRKEAQLPIPNILIRTALPLGADSILLVTLQHGLFILHHDSLTPFITGEIQDISAKNISSAALLADDRIALATNLAGCIIINRNGKFIQRLTKGDGVQNNNVLSVMMDRDRNLWMGLDNGIDLINYSNAIRNIFPDRDNRNSGYTSLLHANQLYLGLSTGVYKVKVDPATRDMSYTIGAFEFIENSEGQVWSLSNVNDHLMMGHNKGAYLIDGSRAIPLETKTGFWGFQNIGFGNFSSLLAAGTYNGLSFYRFAGGRLSEVNAYAGVESARFVAIGSNIIWIAHPYKGIYSIGLDENGPGTALKYKDERGFLSSNHNKIFKLGERIILTTDNGIFQYDDRQKDFVKAGWLEKLLGPGPVSYLKEDLQGNIWFCRDRKVAVFDRSGKEPRIISIPEIDGRIMANGFENINVTDSFNVLIAAEKGFFHINYPAYKKNKQSLHVLIRKVQSTLQDDGLIYGGYGRMPVDASINFAYNSLHFEFSTVLYGQEQHTEYSYYLEGFDRAWSAWVRKTEKDYTNLPAGNYVFRVKSRNNSGNESAVASFSFQILPPWYQTWWGYSLFAIIFLVILYSFYKYQQRKYKRLQRAKLLEQQRKNEEEQRQLQLQHELALRENEKQIIQLRNEKLQSEVQHKNSELASSAMNLVRKKEILSKLKDDLSAYKNTPEAERAGKEFQKILKVIDKELDHNEEWEQFAVHFDSVHSDYLKKLKDRYPALTTSDLKLAAYLRLSLSSKEIAQLMNISIRGVETSRYRLRKKLGLDNETHLFDFLLRATS